MTQGPSTPDRLLHHRQQSRWDELLLEGWRGDWSLAKVMHRWSVHFGFVKPYKEGGRMSFDALHAAISHLKRVPSRQMVFLGKTPVRAYVQEYLRPLSEMLWADATDRDALLAMRRMEAAQFGSEWVHESKLARQRAGRLLRGTRFVEKRKLDRLRDWNVVK